MEPTDKCAQQSQFVREQNSNETFSRIVPILQASNTQSSASSSEDSMDRNPSSSTVMAPPVRMSPENEANGTHEQIVSGDQAQNNSLTGPNAAAAGGQQPKVVQTAFIHKLYNMLEDQNIQHLISWSNSAESFVMSPSNDFSKVLSQYFKHTNISSFVRQLNMYGFHKVSDVFQTGAPDTALWEFKHGNGNFKRGDLVGLREIKRRASRHALVHRDSYSGPKPPHPQSGTSTESFHPQLQIHESTESRIANLEHTSCEIHALLHRAEENAQLMQVRNQVMLEALSRSLHLNNEMSKVLLSIVPNSDIPIHRDVTNMQVEIERQIDLIRSLDDQSEHRAYFSTGPVDSGPVSPRQIPQETSRRSSTMGVPTRNIYHRPPIQAHLPAASRRFGSVGMNNPQSPPGSHRFHAPPTPQSHPLANSVHSQSPPTNLPRRHTSVDIRNVHGWYTNPQPNGHGQSLCQWPPSPKRSLSAMNEEQHIQDSFNSYSLTNSLSQPCPENSRPSTPPQSLNGSTIDHLNNWSWASTREKSEVSGPPTRRGSMAHILNPADTSERNEEHEEDLREDDRKRKRVK